MYAPTPSLITQKKDKNYIIELDSKSYNLSLIIISFIDNITIPQKIYEEKDEPKKFGIYIPDFFNSVICEDNMVKVKDKYYKVFKT